MTCYSRGQVRSPNRSSKPTRRAVVAGIAAGAVAAPARIASAQSLEPLVIRVDFLPWGVQGGQSGSGNYAEIRRADGSMERVTKIAQAPLVEGDLVRLYTGTGGGWGAPAERPREQVLQDLKNGYITAAQAREHYGLTGA